MSRLFGVGTPKFKYGTTTVTIPYARLYPTWQDDRVLEDEDILTGERFFTHLWTHAEFKIIVLLNKYSSASDARAKYNELIAYNHLEVDEFYPFADKTTIGDGLGLPLKDSSGTLVKVFFSYMSPGSLDDYNRLDILEIYCKTKKPFDISKSVII